MYALSIDMTDTEYELIQASLKDPRAFAPLYESYAPAIYRLCLRTTGDPDLAEDLSSAIFVRVLERLDRYEPRPNATFRSWLYTIARNMVHDYWRHQRPTRSLDDAEIEFHDPAPGPEDIAVHRDDLYRVRELLGHLNERQRDIVELRLSGLTTSEIATVLGTTVSSLKSAQMRAYTKLRYLESNRKGSSS